MLSKLSFAPFVWWAPSKLPSLKRLHHVAGYNPSNILANLVKHAPPSYTHLRFSNHNYLRYQFCDDLARCFGLENDLPSGWTIFTETSWTGGVEARLEHLQHIVIHSYPPKPEAACGTNVPVWSALCDHMHELAGAIRQLGGSDGRRGWVLGDL